MKELIKTAKFLVGLKAFASPAPAHDSDCNVSKLIMMIACMENVMSEKSWKANAKLRKMLLLKTISLLLAWCMTCFITF